ncbi:DUF805 domain-containing protein [Alkalicaulis satelles]|uniref:DUF805 domain-containing protein n=1 Tax=Alkalicaulis satelles TaxID=2609175 RepID=A0A5M6ZI30_9PROT|nr:DUF805 domain-containing protein [Alkalicaulis satelles]KAA5804473.1 DUF805 domain-containing protein [Alkalicaulis satelles]
MLVWLITRNHEHFHPSAFLAASNPQGRAAQPMVGFTGSAAYFAVCIRIGLVFLLGGIAAILTSLVLLWLAVGIHPLLAFSSFTPIVLFTLLWRLDFFFWLIRRAHDHGRSWVWAIGPLCAPPITLLSIGLALFLGGLVAGLITAALVILCVAIPAIAYVYHLMHAPGQAGPNRYGPPDTPIPDHWLKRKTP